MLFKLFEKMRADALRNFRNFICLNPECGCQKIILLNVVQVV